MRRMMLLPILNAGDVRKRSLLRGIPLGSAAPRPWSWLTTTMIRMERIAVMNIWFMNGMLTKMGASDQPFGPTLKYRAIGTEAMTPHIAALFVARFQNSPVRKTARMPGLTTPVNSWINWNACPRLPNAGAMAIAMTSATTTEIRPTRTVWRSVALRLM